MAVSLVSRDDRLDYKLHPEAPVDVKGAGIIHMALWLQLPCRAPRKDAHSWKRLSAFWILCAVAAASFGVCSVLHIASVGYTVKFVFALIALTAACSVQRYTLLQIVVELSRQQQVLAPLVLESFLR